MSEPAQDLEPSAQLASAKSSTIARLLGKERQLDHEPPVTLQSARIERQKTLPKEAYHNTKRSTLKLDSDVNQLLSDADAFIKARGKTKSKQQSTASRSKTTESPRSKSRGPSHIANGIYMEGTMTLEALNEELKSGEDATAQLRQMLIAANKRIIQLEAQIKRMKERTSIRAGEDISMLLEQTDAARLISVADMLKPMATKAPANWELTQEKLKDKCRQLIQALNQEKEQHEEVERNLRIENMGLTRRLKYTVLRVHELENKLKSQDKYIKDCEAAILKQHRIAENFRMKNTRIEDATSERNNPTNSTKGPTNAPSPKKKYNAKADSPASKVQPKEIKDETISDSSFHLTPKKRPADSMGSFTDDSGLNLPPSNKINLSDLSDDFDI